MSVDTFYLACLHLGWLAFACLSAVWVRAWRNGALDTPAPAAALLTTLWFLLAGFGAPTLVQEIAETCAYLAWMWMLVGILCAKYQLEEASQLRVPRLLFFAAAATAAIGVFGAVSLLATQQIASAVYVTIVSKLTLCVLGLVFIEQLVRNTRRGHQWNLKFLCLGLGILFGYGFVIYAEAMLFNRVSLALLAPFGLLAAMSAVLMGVAARRNRQQTLSLNLAPEFVFRFGVVAAVGGYLMIISLASVWVQNSGGDWGLTLAVILAVFSLVGLAIMLTSTRFRAHIRQGVRKYVYTNTYDYRHEWDRVTHELSRSDSRSNLVERAIFSLGHVTNSTEGAYWRMSAAGALIPEVHIKAPWCAPLSKETGQALQRFFKKQEQVIDLRLARLSPEQFPGLEIGLDLDQLGHARFVVPLMIEEKLHGLIVLAEPQIPTSLSDEQQRLLSLVARQVAGFMALRGADTEVANHRTFRVMDQLSAFVMHDLKNISSQMSLMLSNAEQHKSNPAFIDDLLSTVEASAKRVDRLLDRLNDPHRSTRVSERIELSELVARAIEHHGSALPLTSLENTSGTVWVEGNAELLRSAMDHILNNAREAAGESGRVAVEIQVDAGWAVVSVEDDGPGMTRAFIEDELFRPFASTKGRSGMGVGAYQAREQVRDMGGELAVTSTPGSGTRSAIYLPVAASRQIDTRKSDGQAATVNS